jgi:lipopolysaccharide transport system ATP-binding protein
MSADTIALDVHGLSKAYAIAHVSQRHSTIREALVGRVARAFTPVPRDTFWALRDVSFQVARGEAVGLIGRNGAGKSTLLKILSRITEPTEGEARLNGRVGSLLEVGTGFHPELTGRENIFLNGAILGMRRREIDRQFDAIVDFAEVERFLDTPVKRYSSGMYVRLAFAVAAHLNPEILVVDEVLAVGDAAFQAKCLGKMQNVASQEGRTVLFVSHNMAAVSALCQRVILLDAGRIAMDGPASQVVDRYHGRMFASSHQRTDLQDVERSGSGRARFVSVAVTPHDAAGEALPATVPGCDLTFDLVLESGEDVQHTIVAVVVYDARGYRLVDLNSELKGEYPSLRAGERLRVQFVARDVRLKPGSYLVGLWVGRRKETIDHIDPATTFTVAARPEDVKHEHYPGPYMCEFDLAVRAADERPTRAAAHVGPGVPRVVGAPSVGAPMASAPMEERAAS